MRGTRHNGRSGKDGVYNPKHNDRNFDIGNSDHIFVFICNDNYSPILPCYILFFYIFHYYNDTIMLLQFKRAEPVSEHTTVHIRGTCRSRWLKLAESEYLCHHALRRFTHAWHSDVLLSVRICFDDEVLVIGIAMCQKTVVYEIPVFGRQHAKLGYVYTLDAVWGADI